MLGDQVDESALAAGRVGPVVFLGGNAPAVFVGGAFDLLAHTDLEGKAGLMDQFQKLLVRVLHGDHLQRN